jgi:hypothetical protein
VKSKEKEKGRKKLTDKKSHKRSKYREKKMRKVKGGENRVNVNKRK